MAVLYEKKGKIAYVTLNRPEAMNAYNLETLKELEKIWCDFRDDPTVWVAILTGTGDTAFCAGMDLKEATIRWEWGHVPADEKTLKRSEFVQEWGVSQTARGTQAFGIPRTLHWRTIENLNKPLIAAINGYCLMGGLEMACACDIRIVAENARLGFPAVKWGLASPNFFPMLASVFGYTTLLDLLITGRQIDAEEAYRMGIANKVVPPDKLMPTAIEWAENLCNMGPLAVRAYKEIGEMWLAKLRAAFPDLMKRASELAYLTHASEDAKEGLKAFAEKRKPQFEAE